MANKYELVVCFVRRVQLGEVITLELSGDKCWHFLETAKPFWLRRFGFKYLRQFAGMPVLAKKVKKGRAKRFDLSLGATTGGVLDLLPLTEGMIIKEM